MGLDLGQKRVGVARSDETGTIAEAYRTITFESKAELVTKLRQCVSELGPEKVVVGLPETLSGKSGPAAEKVRGTVEWLSREIPGEWVFWDERLTTAEAERILLTADLSRARRKEVRDKLAAQRILQNYLDRRNNG